VKELEAREVTLTQVSERVVSPVNMKRTREVTRKAKRKAGEKDDAVNKIDLGDL